ncbi:hypothetical protein M5K25_022026 [Dendrobium thyrsiflorum]|uniref:MaoC-like domain-containing protein n=1 Tax=Dendrobium thyrsiflorum TaxID=117978 RepID=A0ABD0U5G4_DENTH
MSRQMGSFLLPRMHVDTLIRPFPRRCTAAAYCFSSSLEAARSPLKVGDVLRETRRFSAGDVAVYAEVSGDRNPVHLNPDFALRIGGFERGSVVHGMLVASLFPSVISSNFGEVQNKMLRKSRNSSYGWRSYGHFAHSDTYPITVNLTELLCNEAHQRNSYQKEFHNIFILSVLVNVINLLMVR